MIGGRGLASGLAQALRGHSALAARAPGSSTPVSPQRQQEVYVILSQPASRSDLERGGAEGPEA